MKLGQDERDRLDSFVLGIECDELEENTAAVIERLETLVLGILEARLLPDRDLQVIEAYKDRTRGVEDIAAEFGISGNTVRRIAIRAGLPPRRTRVYHAHHQNGTAWTPAEEARLAELMGRTPRPSWAEIGRALKRTRGSVKGKVDLMRYERRRAYKSCTA